MPSGTDNCLAAATLNIAICDDELPDCKALAALLRTVCTKLDLTARTDIFSCGEDFLAAYKLSPYDIVFMDINMDGISGTDTMRRAISLKRCCFIFTTVSSEYALEAFALQAAHYLLKPLNEESVTEAVRRCLPMLQPEEVRVLDIKTTQGNVPVPMDSISYIESMNKICHIHTQKNRFCSYISLNALYELLDATLFMRAQRSYIVNMRFIDSFYFDRIVLHDGTEIMLSRTNRAELKKQYQQFLFRLARREGL